ncbi:GbsR/MarR family transcriptional regulator [Leifsonia poae]|uniref:GbsR/MarR family transcriptional regulator n=1 Tax=Leifsonia poae TaxID=110933 RepID=UPI001CC168A3|nr:MarR family transcriptional regulator [Leifsonia poae]
MAENEQALNDVVERSAAILTSAGFPKMPARVVMALTVEESGGLTAVELSEQLGVSAAAISGAVRYLQQIGIVRRVAQTGSRRDRYELPEDPWYAALASKNEIYEVLAAQADAGAASITDPTSIARARLLEMADFYRFFGRRVPELLEEWEQLRSDQAD